MFPLKFLKVKLHSDYIIAIGGQTTEIWQSAKIAEGKAFHLHHVLKVKCATKTAV